MQFSEALHPLELSRLMWLNFVPPVLQELRLFATAPFHSLVASALAASCLLDLLCRLLLWRDPRRFSAARRLQVLGGARPQADRVVPARTTGC